MPALNGIFCVRVNYSWCYNFTIFANLINQFIVNWFTFDVGFSFEPVFYISSILVGNNILEFTGLDTYSRRGQEANEVAFLEAHTYAQLL